MAMVTPELLGCAILFARTCKRVIGNKNVG